MKPLERIRDQFMRAERPRDARRCVVLRHFFEGISTWICVVMREREDVLSFCPFFSNGKEGSHIVHDQPQCTMLLTTNVLRATCEK
jgi:hypothetical protein